jgi:hypothetical protein
LWAPYPQTGGADERQSLLLLRTASAVEKPEKLIFIMQLKELFGKPNPVKLYRINSWALLQQFFLYRLLLSTGCWSFIMAALAPPFWAATTPRSIRW